MKQTLFLENEILAKLRNIGDIGHLIFITDDTKIKGNVQYDLGNYYEALNIYEQVLACFIWFEFKDASIKEKLFLDPEFTKKSHKVAWLGITDDDIDLHERGVRCEADREIETETSKHLPFTIVIELSFVVSTLHNAMLAYMSVYHFDEALKCADLIIDTYCQDSEFYYRKA